MGYVYNFKKEISAEVNYNCILTTPTGFDKEKKSLPMIVFLHGMGERGDDVERVRLLGIAKLFSNDPDYAGTRVITLSPQCPANSFWTQETHGLKVLIESVAEEYNVDKDRISLTGLSMGGYGTWCMGMDHPELFSALAPICGGGIPYNPAALAKFPIWTFHGDKDDIVPIFETQRMVEFIRKAGGDPKFTVFEGVNHASWVPAYEETDVIQWLIAQDRRNIK